MSIDYDADEALAQPLTDEERYSWGSRARQAGLTGLGYVGSTLDKMFGGRAARGAAEALVTGGKEGAREILSVLPFSDYLGITDPEQAVSGEKIIESATGVDPTQQHGYTGAWAVRNLAGPAVEMALDPANILGGIAAPTRRGLEALKAGEKVPGILEKGYLQAVKEGRRTLMHGITGRRAGEAAEAVVEAGAGANRAVREALPAVAKGQDWLGEQFAENIQPTYRALFDTEYGRARQRDIQAAHKEFKVPREEALRQERDVKWAEMRGLERQVVERAAEQGADPAHYLDRFQNLMYQAAEGVDPHALSPADFAFAQTLPQEAVDLLGQTKKMGATEPLRLEREAGVRTRELADPSIDYLMAMKNPAMAAAEQRSVWDIITGRGAKQGKVFPTSHEAMQARSDIYRGVPGGRMELNRLIQEHAGKPVEEILPHLQHVGSLEDIPVGPATVVEQSVKELEARRAGLAQWIGSLEPAKIAAGGGKYFSEDPTAAALLRHQMASTAVGSADATVATLGKTAKPFKIEGGRSVLDVLKDARLDTEVGMRRAAEALGIEHYHLEEAAQKAGLPAPREGPVVGLTGQLPGGPAGALPGRTQHLATVLENYYVPQRVAEGLGQLAKGQVSHELSPIAELARRSLQAFRTGAYVVWPNSQVRNAYGGRYEALQQTGTKPWSAAYKLGDAVLKNPRSDIPTGIPSLPTGADLHLSAVKHRIIGGEMSEFAHALPEGVNPSKYFTDPTTARAGLHNAFAEAYKQVTTGAWRNPFSTTPGAEGAAVKLGHALNTIVEDNLRMGQYADLLQRGWTEEAAAQKVFHTHFDYEKVSPALQALKKVTSFPSFTYHNVPKQIGTAITHPGRITTPMRLSGAMQTGEGGEGEGYVPRYLQGGLNIPIPWLTENMPEGTQVYLNKLGLPFEEAFGHVHRAPTVIGSVEETLRDFLSNLRPDIKAGLELVTGTQLHTGRKLSEIEPGDIPSAGGRLGTDLSTAIAQGLSGTPLSRLNTFINRWLDTRRMNLPGLAENLVNAITGAKTTAVDTEKWRALDVKKMMEEQAGRSRNIRQFPEFYVPKDRKENLEEWEVDLMRQLKDWKKQWQETQAGREMEAP